MTSEAMVSVVVPVYQGLKTLRPCLEALERQSYPDYEVIVVDNGGNDGIEGLCAAFGRVRLHSHSTPGSYSSRNAGITVGKGEIFAFTDADCVPERDWIQRGVDGLARHSCRMAGGWISPAFERDSAPTIIELCDAILHTMNQEQTLREVTSVACANMFVHRSLFEAVGVFNGHLYSAGDCEFTYRVRQRKEKIVCIDDAVVLHRARRTIGELSERYRRFAGAEFAAKTAGNRHDPVSELRSLSFGYRAVLCLKNIIEGVRAHRMKRNPLTLLGALILVEGYITATKTVEYVRLGLGKEMQR